MQLRTDLARNRGLGVVEDSHGEAQGIANGRIPYDDHEWDLKNVTDLFHYESVRMGCKSPAWRNGGNIPHRRL